MTEVEAVAVVNPMAVLETVMDSYPPENGMTGCENASHWPANADPVWLHDHDAAAELLKRMGVESIKIVPAS